MEYAVRCFIIFMMTFYLCFCLNLVIMIAVLIMTSFQSVFFFFLFLLLRPPKNSVEKIIPGLINLGNREEKELIMYFALKALRHIRQISQEMGGEVVYGLGRQPAVMRNFSKKLSR